MIDDGPTVSVVLPTYNRANVLHGAIRSVLNQTYRDLELIVVDDGSTDETMDLVKAIEDDRLRYISHQTNRGASAARNTGIEDSLGDFIAFQDSDDKWKPKKLQKQMEVFQRVGPNVAVVYTGCWRIFNGEQRLVPQPAVEPKEGDLSDVLLYFNFISLQTAVVRKEYLNNVGGLDERLPRLQDWELWLRMAEFYEFRYVDEPLVTAQVRADSISSSVERMADAREHILEKHRDRFDGDALAYQLFRTGHSQLKAGHARKARKTLIQAIQQDFRAIYLAMFLMSLLGSNVYKGIYRAFKTATSGFHAI